MTFSQYDGHSSPLFKSLQIIKISDLINLNVILFMHKFHNDLLPSVFNNYFTLISRTHNYNTRLASKHSYSIPSKDKLCNIRLCNIRFQGGKLWNSLDESLKFLSMIQLKNNFKLLTNSPPDYFLPMYFPVYAHNYQYNHYSY